MCPIHPPRARAYALPEASEPMLKDDVKRHSQNQMTSTRTDILLPEKSDMDLIMIQEQFPENKQISSTKAVKNTNPDFHHSEQPTGENSLKLKSVKTIPPPNTKEEEDKSECLVEDHINDMFIAKIKVKEKVAFYSDKSTNCAEVKMKEKQMVSENIEAEFVNKGLDSRRKEKKDCKEVKTETNTTKYIRTTRTEPIADIEI